MSLINLFEQHKCENQFKSVKSDVTDVTVVTSNNINELYGYTQLHNDVTDVTEAIETVQSYIGYTRLQKDVTTQPIDYKSGYTGYTDYTENQRDSFIFEITQAERAKLSAWLNHIGETDAEMLAEFWRNIEHKPGAKEYFLKRTEEVPDADTRKYCRQCSHHRPIPGRVAFVRCTVRKAVNLDDLPRHCGDWLDNGLLRPTVGLFQRINP